MTLTWIIRRARESDLKPVNHGHIQRSRRTGMDGQMAPLERRTKLFGWEAVS
ncbi:hypothetical protein CY34DRAFT_801434 [Suillus luteus UH-Slu-Lm8-n1]|uniref:Uncharacterized protein n=1 Tax=Suillus luteus UH-Slu-Lm8-n1 TaxID=930992 RepID=A0A0D0B6V6_9AGAM|nr:hypothetical protein CY34DRAFT_801434 [Suillus luteus UH-Slu-Lm8-n1]